MKKIDYREIGNRIKEKRKKLNMTQEKLSEIIDVSPSYISEIERGTSICSLAVLVDIAEVLDLNLDNLIRGINENNIDTSFSEILKEIPKKNHKLYITICKNIATSFKTKDD